MTDRLAHYIEWQNGQRTGREAYVIGQNPIPRCDAWSETPGEA